MGGAMRFALLALLGHVVACGTGTVSSGRDAGCTEPGCGDAGDAGDASDDGGGASCEGMICPGLQVCREGRCVDVDPCEDVVCSNPGEVCDPRSGECQPGGADDDDDGYTIADGDCDDGDEGIHPGAPDPCDGVDQDCDLEVDDDVPADRRCTPGATERRSCGNCADGDQARACSAACTWDDWGSCSVGGRIGECLDCLVDVGAGSDSDYLGDGWSARESDFTGTSRWTDQLVAELFLGVEPGTESITFTWGAHPEREDCSTGDGTRTGEVRIDGLRAGSISLPDTLPAWTTTTYEIPEDTADDAFLEVQIASDHRFQPSSCGDSADGRWLAIRVERVEACL